MTNRFRKLIVLSTWGRGSGLRMWYTMNEGYFARGALKSVLRVLGIHAKKCLHMKEYLYQRRCTVQWNGVCEALREGKSMFLRRS